MSDLSTGTGLRVSRWVSAGRPLLLAILLCGARIFVDKRPSFMAAAPTLEQHAIPLVWLAVLMAAEAFWRKAMWPRGRQLWLPILSGVALIALPGVLQELGTGFATGGSVMVLLLITPVFALVFAPYLGRGELDDGNAHPLELPAVLVATAAMLYAFPLPIFDSGRSVFGLGLMLFASASTAVGLCLAARLAQLAPVAPNVAIAATSAAVALMVASAGLEHSDLHSAGLLAELGWSLVADLPVLVFYCWLLRTLGPVRMAASGMLYLAMILAELAIEFGTLPSLRQAVALVLTASAAVFLLVRQMIGQDEARIRLAPLDEPPPRAH